MIETIRDRFFTTANSTKLFIVSMDVLLSFLSFEAAILLRHNFDATHNFPIFSNTIVLVLAVRTVSFWLFKTYSGLIRFTGEEDLKQVIKVTTFGTGIFFLLWGLDSQFNTRHLLTPSILIIDYFLLGFLMLNYRIILRIVHSLWSEKGKPKINIIMFGAGESGNTTLQLINRNQSYNYKVVAIFDDNPKVHRKYLEGVGIYDPNKDFQRICAKYKPQKAIVSIQTIPKQRKEEFIDLCLAEGMKVLQVPPANSWTNGTLSLSQIRDVRVEDLLNRPQIVLDRANIREDILGRVILVTGGAGSIGSEICRQILFYQPSLLVVFDQAETPLADLGLELRSEFGYTDFVTVIGSVTEKDRLRRVFETYRPDIVIHASAYKHVPIIEAHPIEAVRVNILGTKNTADLSVEFGVSKFVMISTDKAVNPTNVMGASKRIAEIYAQSLNTMQAKTRFITTRFGNVLGSNGSVIPIFKRQIESGKRVTVTHPEITRYFMTIPEACQLVLEAGAMGKGGEIFLFDMGESVKILDLAINMIKLAGYKPYEDIQIEFSGLRPGEKLTEELLNTTENVLPTHHSKIMIGKTNVVDPKNAVAKIQQLINGMDKKSDLEIVAAMKAIVPEFISNNSQFGVLDPRPAVWGPEMAVAL